MTTSQWMQVILEAITLLTVVFGVFKVVTTAQKGVDSHEKRITLLEAKIDTRSTQMDSINLGLCGLASKFDLLEQEMKRVRDRVDRYLDGEHQKSDAAALLLETIKRSARGAPINVEG
jgi:septal ring factor EnvC (AmiA/AmiB activator)